MFLKIGTSWGNPQSPVTFILKTTTSAQYWAIRINADLTWPEPCGQSAHPRDHVSVKNPTCFWEPDFPQCPWGNIVAAVEPLLVPYCGLQVKGNRCWQEPTLPNKSQCTEHSVPEIVVWDGRVGLATKWVVRETVGARQKPRASWRSVGEHACFLQDSPDPKSFFALILIPQRLRAEGCCGRARRAKSPAWKMLQGDCSRLTLHCFGIQFTWCYTVRDFLFHIIMYILYAAFLFWFCHVAFSSTQYNWHGLYSNKQYFNATGLLS